MKCVDQYQIEQSSLIKENGYEIYKAKHIKTKELFSLKKINNHPSNKRQYQMLINQVSLLKQMDFLNIMKCYKLLKTSNNMYIVYDNIFLNTLQNTIHTIKNLSLLQREALIKQIVLSLVYMKKRGIVHLNLTPKNIYQTEHGTIKIGNFLYGQLIDQQNQVSIQNSPPESQFISPQVLKQKIGSFASDVYSLGKIMFAMQLCKEQSTFLQVTAQLASTNQLATLMRKMISKNPADRVTIEQVQSYFFKKSLKIRKSSSRGSSKSNKSIGSASKQSKQKNKVNNFNSVATIQLTTLKNISSNDKLRNILSLNNILDKSERDKSSKSNKSNKSNKSIRLEISGEKKKKTLRRANTLAQDPQRFNDDSKGKTELQIMKQQSKRFNQYVLQMLKFRNLSVYTLKIAKTVSQVEVSNHYHEFLSFVLFKKSSDVITKLNDFVTSGRGIPQIVINRYDRVKLTSQPEYFHLSAILGEECSKQVEFLKEFKSQMQFSPELAKQSRDFQQKIVSQKPVQDEFLKECVQKYVKALLQIQLEKLNKNQLINLVMLAQILPFETYQKVFDELIDEKQAKLQNQLYVLSLASQQSEQLIQNLQNKAIRYC